MVRFRQCLLNSLLVSGNRLMTQGTGTGIACGYRSTWHRRDQNNYSTSSGIPGTRERTLIAVKPDGVQRRLIGQVIQRFEQRGFRLVGLKMVQASDELISQHYAALNRKPFYPSLLRYMTSGPVVAMVWEGHNVVKSSRMLVGSTNPAEAAPGTLRGDFSIHINRNIVHASDSVEVAQREISLWFQRSELTTWESCDHTSICHT